jgi:hypothetical protein
LRRFGFFERSPRWLVSQVSQPEGVMVFPLDSSIVYMGGINSTTLAVANVSHFWHPFVVELRTGVGAQLVRDAHNNHSA